MKIVDIERLGVTEKHCTKCDKLLPLNMFSRVNVGRSNEKLHSWCNPCKRSDNARHFKRNGKKYIETQKKKHLANPEIRRRKDRERYANDPERREIVRQRNKKLTESGYRSKYMREYRKKNPKENIKQRARQTIHNHLNRGLAEASRRCDRCGITGVKLEAHHYDYARPLEVDYLCTTCHNEWHVRFDIRLFILDELQLKHVDDAKLNNIKASQGFDFDIWTNGSGDDCIDKALAGIDFNEVVYIRYNRVLNTDIISVILRKPTEQMKIRYNDLN